MLPSREARRSSGAALLRALLRIGGSPQVAMPSDASPCAAELNEMLAKGINPADQSDVIAHLTPESADVSAPPALQHTGG